jgi:hypothetical protein
VGQDVYKIIRVGLAEVFEQLVVVVWVGEAVVEFMTKLIEFAPEVEKALRADKAFLVRAAMNDHSIKDFKLVGVELLQVFFYLGAKFIFHSIILSDNRYSSGLGFFVHSFNLAIICIKNI